MRTNRVAVNETADTATEEVLHGHDIELGNIGHPQVAAANDLVSRNVEGQSSHSGHLSNHVQSVIHKFFPGAVTKGHHEGYNTILHPAPRGHHVFESHSEHHDDHDDHHEPHHQLLAKKTARHVAVTPLEDVPLETGHNGKKTLSSKTDATHTTAVSEASSNTEAKNGVFMSVFLILNTMIGSGILNLPYVFMKTGVIGAIVMLLISAMFTWLSMVAIVDCGLTVNIMDYSELGKLAFGRTGELMVDFSMVISNVGVMMSYLIVIGGTTSDMLLAWGCDNEFCNVTNTTLVIVVLFIAPFCMMRNFGSLASESFYSMLAMAIVLGFVVIAGPMIAGGQSNISGGGSITMFSGLGGLQNLGSIVYSLAVTMVACETYRSMKDANPKAWRAVCRDSISAGVFMLGLMGLAGYLSFKQYTDGQILDNFQGVYSYAFKLILVVHLILCVPTGFMVMRKSLVRMATGVASGNLASLRKHVLLTVSMLAAITAIAIALRMTGMSQGGSFGLVLNFTGGVTFSMISFVLPAAFYLKLMPKDAPLYKLCWVMLFAGLSVMVIVPVTSLLITE